MNYLGYILAVAAGAIAALVAYGLAPGYNGVWAAVAGVAALLAVGLASRILMRPDDRDPTIRPTNIPRKRPDR